MTQRAGRVRPCTTRRRSPGCACATPTGTVDVQVVYTGNAHVRGRSGVDCRHGRARRRQCRRDPFAITAVVPVGGFSFQAHYNGDDTYNGSTGACEPLTGRQARLVDGDRHPQRRSRGRSPSAPLGSTVHDKATVSGRADDPDRQGRLHRLHGQHAVRGRGLPLPAQSRSTAALRIRPTSRSWARRGLSYKAHYSRRRHVQRSTGPCEPLTGRRRARSTVVKDFVNAPEDATVTLRIRRRRGHARVRSARRDGGSISKVLPPGTYTRRRGRAARATSNLDLYTSSIACVEHGESARRRRDDAGTSAAVDLANGDDITCTITNGHVEAADRRSRRRRTRRRCRSRAATSRSRCVVTNSSSIDPITITSLVDDKFGDLTADCGIPGAEVEPRAARRARRAPFTPRGLR